MKKSVSILIAMVLCVAVSAYAQQAQQQLPSQQPQQQPQSQQPQQPQQQPQSQQPQQQSQATVAEPAQSSGDGANRLAAIVGTPQSEWLGSFDKVNISGAMQVSLIRIAESEGPKIYFDTKGSTTTKFKVEVDKKGVLNLAETVDSKRTTITEVKIYYRDISSLTVSGASVNMEQAFEGKMLDVAVSGGATVKAKVDVLDMEMTVTGRSSVILEGSSRYLGLKVSTAKFDASGLQTMSTTVEASPGAEVSLFVTERLSAMTATSAKISYKGNPSLVRVHSSLFGGDIVSSDK